MALPWGVMEEIDSEKLENIREYINMVVNTKIHLDTGERARILKADIKERKGQYKLIYRYQLD